MAGFGAANPRWAPITSEPIGILPEYGAPVTIGRMVKADRTIQYASGKLYADNELAESVDEFVSATVAEETDDILDEVAGKIYGATVEGKQVRYRAGDTAPYGGHTYYKVYMRNGEKVFKGYFYPKVKAVMGNDTAQSKTDSITFSTAATTFTVFRSSSDDWCITEILETEAEAIEWCDEKLNPTSGG